MCPLHIIKYPKTLTVKIDNKYYERVNKCHKFDSIKETEKSGTYREKRRIRAREGREEIRRKDGEEKQKERKKSR